MSFDPGGNPFRLRIGLDTDNLASGEFKLYAKKNSGSYAPITTTSTGGVQSYDASSDADDTIIRVPRLYPFSSGWQLAGSAIDLDFAGNRVYPGGVFTDYLSCSRASDGYAQNSTGGWVQFSSNVLRITDLGLLIEDARTNYLLQSGSPATQTTQSLGTGSYTLWVEGSGSALASGGTATITGAASATDGSPNTFTVTVAGTVDVTVTGTLTRFQLEGWAFGSSYIPTTTSTAARAADGITVASTLDTDLNGTNASVVVDVKCVGVDGVTDQDLLYGTDNFRPIIIASSDTACSSVATPGFCYVAPYPNSATSTGGVKIAIGWSATGLSLSAVGSTATSGSTPAGFSPYTLGGAPSRHLNAYVRRLTVWTSRLSDATLQELTAP